MSLDRRAFLCAGGAAGTALFLPMIDAAHAETGGRTEKGEEDITPPRTCIRRAVG